jgi:hypothetical protein
MAVIGMTGGDGLKRRLEEIRRNLGQGEELRLGFLEGSTYPDGTPTAQIAAIQEFGATIKVEAHQTTIFRKIDKSGEFMKNGRFVKQNLSNFATTHDVPEHTVTIPARPYFRHMIEAKSSRWGEAMAKNLKATDYDANATLARMGDSISGQLQRSIRDLYDPPLAPSTIRAKKDDKPLIETGHMLNSVAFEVTGS